MNTETDTINEHFTLCEAAPDLLAALQEFDAACSISSRNGKCGLGQVELNHLWLKARRAIAKAKGDK